MAEIRCPMCGKENPDHLDVCQFCQARLNPLGSIPPSDSSSIFPEDLESDDELPDWMDFDADFGDSEDNTPFEEGTEDWMSRLGGDTETETQAFSTNEGNIMAESRAAARMDYDDDGIPDWMEDLEKDRTTPPMEESRDPFEREIPDFFASDQEAETPAVADESGDQFDWFMDSGDEDAESAEPAQEGGLPDWLISSDESETASLDETSGVDTELPDFFSDRDQEEAEPISPIADGELPETTGYVAEETLPLSDFEGGLPDWLSDTGSNEISSTEEEPETILTPGDQDAGLPAWLISDEGEGQAEPTSEEDIPDWLKGTAETEESPIAGLSETTDAPKPFDIDTGDLEGLFTDEAAEESALPANESDLPVWLTEGAAAEAATTEAGEDADEEPAQPATESDLPDWLSDLSEDGEPSAEPPKAPKPFDMDTGDLENMLAEATAELEKSGPPPERELPDWLSPTAAAVGAAAASEAADEGEDNIPDWLSGLAGDELESQEMAVPSEEGSDADLPDWLSDLSAQEDAQTVETPKATKPFDMDTGDLESMFSDKAAETEAAEIESAAPAAESDLPAWLAGDVATDAVATDAVAAETAEDSLAETAQAAAEGDLPDWLSDDMAADEESAQEIEEPDIPEWLSDFESDEGATSSEAVSAEAAASAMDAEDDETLPDWLTEGTDEPAAADEEELPDWLKDSAAGVAAAGAIGAAASLLSENEEENPDWLSDLSGVEEPSEETPAEETGGFGESRAIPSWLQDTEESLEGVPLGGETAADNDLEEEDIFEFDQLTEWISDEALTDADQPQEITGQADDLSPAELPGWLAAMRPVESSTTDEAGEVERGPMENAGPLAGLYSVLVAEPDISRLKKPPTYSSKLQITDSQQNHANMLRELLETEGKPQPLPLPSLISSQRIFRLVLSIIIVVIAFLAVIAGGDLAAMPQAGNIPPGVFETSDLVNALSANDTVLIAFDYEPGLSGEMEATSSAVVDSMMLKGAKLAVVSTSPTGPALAERFINNVQNQHHYQSGTQYVNLGYIPGGISGLAAFAQNPHWVAPNTLEGLSAWETAPLSNIGRVSDFALALVITDNPNTARAWIEQVNPKLGAVPLVLVVSAQVEPMVRPYFNNQQGQVDGIISGLTGAAAYEVVSRPNLARSYWDAFNILLIVAVSSILIGGAINVISTLLAQRKEPGEEAK